jgi:hypothetical protein
MSRKHVLALTMLLMLAWAGVDAADAGMGRCGSGRIATAS